MSDDWGLLSAIEAKKQARKHKWGKKDRINHVEPCNKELEVLEKVRETLKRLREKHTKKVSAGVFSFNDTTLDLKVVEREFGWVLE